MSEITFKVIENYKPDIDYEEFKKDFLNPCTRVPELREKYGLSKGEWKKYRKRVLDECGLNRKPYRLDYYGTLKKYLPDKCPIKHGDEYIQKKPNGYIVVKTTDGVAMYFGRYATIECARKIRNKLVASDWDRELGAYLKMKYGVERMKPMKIKALSMYPEFEKKYIYSDKKVLEII